MRQIPAPVGCPSPPKMASGHLILGREWPFLLALLFGFLLPTPSLGQSSFFSARGYQPPPNPPLVDEYMPSPFHLTAPPPIRWPSPIGPVPPSPQPPAFRPQIQVPAASQTMAANEPLLVNTLIQVFAPSQSADGRPAISLAEARTVSTVASGNGAEQQPSVLGHLNGQKRVILMRQLDTQKRTFVPEAAISPAASPREIAFVKAFAATNSSRMTEAELREALGKELDQSVPLILEELERVAATGAPTPSAGPGTSELEGLVGEGLAQLETTTTVGNANEEQPPFLFRTETIQVPAEETTTVPLLVFTRTQGPSYSIGSLPSEGGPSPASTPKFVAETFAKEEGTTREVAGTVMPADELLPTAAQHHTETSISATEKTETIASTSTVPPNGEETSGSPSPFASPLPSSLASPTTTEAAITSQSNPEGVITTETMPATITNSQSASTRQEIDAESTPPSTTIVEQSSNGISSSNTQSILSAEAEGSSTHDHQSASTETITKTSVSAESSSSQRVPESEFAEEASISTEQAAAGGASQTLANTSEESSTSLPNNAESTPASVATTTGELSTTTTSHLMESSTAEQSTATATAQQTPQSTPLESINGASSVVSLSTTEATSSSGETSATSTAVESTAEAAAIISTVPSESASSTTTIDEASSATGAGQESSSSTTVGMRTAGELAGWERTDFERGQLWVHCGPESIQARLRPSPPSNGTKPMGVLFARDFHDQAECFAELGEEMGEEANLEIGQGQCGLASVESSEPPGKNLSLVLLVAPRRALVLGEPEHSFLVQCFVPALPAQRQLSADLAIQEPAAAPQLARTIALEQAPPECEYSLRRDSPNGPRLDSAALGQSIFHRWECRGGQQIAEQFGIFLSDCVATNLSREGQPQSAAMEPIELVDAQGCSVDHALLDELEYADDRLLAVARAKVFSLRPQAHRLRFSCRLSLCLRQGGGCHGLTPPQCPPPSNESVVPQSAALSRRHLLDDALAPAALRQRLFSPQLSVMAASPAPTEGQSSPASPRLPFLAPPLQRPLLGTAWSAALLLLCAVLLGLFLGLAAFLLHSRQRRSRRARLVQWVLARPPTSESSGSEEEGEADNDKESFYDLAPCTEEAISEMARKTANE